jgi:hypothetical protein
VAGFFQQFLKGTADGFLGSPYLRDYQHASKIFLTNGYGNAPKFKYLFHVYFDINQNRISDSYKLFPDTTNHGLLVKTIDLPKYTIPLTEMNQYNRKRYVQTKINYEPIRVTFHDDNSNQIRNLWHAYYSYYYNDPSQPGNLNSTPQARTVPGQAATELNKRNIYSPLLQNNQRNWGYLGEIGQTVLSTTVNPSKIPFFKSIKIFGFNQHNFALYELINPVIESFSHDTYSYADGAGTMENSMGIRYESVKYFDGALNGQNPGQIVDRFAEDGLYDKTLSPIARNGTNRSILGQGGLVDSVNGVLDDLSNGNILGAIQTAGRASRTFKNSQQLLQTAKAELVGGVISAVSNPATARTQFNWPGLGTTSGPGGQAGNATNSAPSTAPPVSTPGNTPITRGSGQ